MQSGSVRSRVIETLTSYAPSGRVFFNRTYPRVALRVAFRFTRGYRPSLLGGLFLILRLLILRPSSYGTCRVILAVGSMSKKRRIGGRTKWPEKRYKRAGERLMATLGRVVGAGVDFCSE